MKPISNYEIQRIVFQILALKSLGLDGFSGGFFHDHWDVVGDEIISMVKAF